MRLSPNQQKVLDYIKTARRPPTVLEISLGIPTGQMSVTNVYRSLVALMDRGLVKADAGRTYKATEDAA